MSVNPEDWDVDFAFPIVLMRTKLMYKLNRNLTEEENASQCLKILSQYTVKKTRIDWQRFEMYCLREMSTVEPRYFERG